MSKRKKVLVRSAGIVAGSVIMLAMAGCGTTGSDPNAGSTESVSQSSVEDAKELTPQEQAAALLQDVRNAYYGTADAVRDHAKALELCSQVLELDDSAGDAYYYQGRINEENYKYEDASDCYEKGMEKGSELSRMALGYLYLNGNGKRADFNKARELFNQAVENGCAEANTGLGDFYQDGSFDLTADPDLAAEYFEKAAAGTEPEWVAYAQSSLGSMYSGTAGFDSDFDKAVELCTKAHDTLGYGYQDIVATIYQSAILNADKAKEYYTLARDEFQKEADAGISDSEFALGRMYKQGLGVDADNAKAMELIEKAANEGNRNAMTTLAGYYYDGFSVDRDCTKAIEWYEKAAEAGAYSTLFQIGKMYAIGDGVEKDADKAKEYFDKYMKEGGESAELQMASVYEVGSLGEKDQAKAVELYQKAADAGNVQAMVKLGNCYFAGTGVDKDQAKAAEWFQKSAEAGNERLYLDLGYMYLRGEGFEKDEEKALECFDKYAKHDGRAGAYVLGSQYLTGTIVDKDLEKAKTWLEKAANEGDKNAMVSLAGMYLSGEGVDKSADEAVKWLEKSVDAGNAISLINIANIYAKGNGVDKDEAKAEEYIGKYATNADRMYSLGECYYLGNGVDKDDKKAFEWMQKASDAGSIRAAIALGAFYKQGLGVDKDEARSFEYYQKASDAGELSSMYIVAQSYIWGDAIVNGEKVTDVEKGLALADKAANAGSKDAALMLGVIYSGRAKDVEVETDDRKAFTYLGMAANSGDTNAVAILKEMTDKETYTKEDTNRWLYSMGK